MNEAAISKKLVQLTEAMKVSSMCPTGGRDTDGIYLPQAAGVEPSAEETLECISLQVKYLLFDLEATRRENRYLRQMLEGRPPAGTEDAPPTA